MEKKIDLDEIIQSELNLYMIKWINKCEYRKRLIKDAMEEAIRQSLELAAENAKFKFVEITTDGGEIIIAHTKEHRVEYSDEYIEIDKKSILDTINQVKI